MRVILLVLFTCMLSLNAHAIKFYPASGGGGGSATSPAWQEFIISYTDFTAAATTENIVLVSLPADSVIHGVQIKHTTAFAGGGATLYTLSVGIPGDLDRLASNFPVTTVVTDTNHQDSLALDAPDTGAPVSVRLRAISDVNLNTLGAGVARVRLLISNP
jgi:hypothetical protein